MKPLERVVNWCCDEELLPVEGLKKTTVTAYEQNGELVYTRSLIGPITEDLVVKVFSIGSFKEGMNIKPAKEKKPEESVFNPEPGTPPKKFPEKLLNGEEVGTIKLLENIQQNDTYYGAKAKCGDVTGYIRIWIKSTRVEDPDTLCDEWTSGSTRTCVFKRNERNGQNQFFVNEVKACTE